MQAYLVGASFRPAEARDHLSHLTLGDTIALEAEPANPFDPFAVKCLSGGHHVGYISRESNFETHEALLRGEPLHARIVAVMPKLRFGLEIVDGEAPTS